MFTYFRFRGLLISGMFWWIGICISSSTPLHGGGVFVFFIWFSSSTSLHGGGVFVFFIWFSSRTPLHGGAVYLYFFFWFSSSTSLLGGGVPRGYRLIASHENNEEDKIIIKNFLSSLLFENYSKTITDGFKKTFS